MIELFLSVLAASFVGSLHCAGMCGPLVGLYSAEPNPTQAAAQTGRRRMLRSHAFYHLARGLSYVLLGVAAGGVGAALDLAGRSGGVERLAGAIAGILIVLMGSLQLMLSLPLPVRERWLGRFRSLQGSSGGVLGRMVAALSHAVRRALSFVAGRPVTVRALSLGFASALLPCGWLYAFVATAAGSGTPNSGAVVMLAFWLGTIPALLGTGLGLARLARVLGGKVSVIMGIVLVVLGISTVAMRSRMVFSPKMHPRCHDSMEQPASGASSHDDGPSAKTE